MRVVIFVARPTRNMLAAVLAIMAISGGSLHAAEPPRIVDVTLGKPIVYGNSHGDVWEATWADDGELYSCSDDTNGFNNACHSNFAYHKLSGDDPARLVGVTVNPMKDYGQECAGKRTIAPGKPTATSRSTGRYTCGSAGTSTAGGAMAASSPPTPA